MSEAGWSGKIFAGECHGSHGKAMVKPVMNDPYPLESIDIIYLIEFSE